MGREPADQILVGKARPVSEHDTGVLGGTPGEDETGVGWVRETGDPGSNVVPAAWRATWTAIFVFLAGAVQQVVADPEVMTRLMRGEASNELWRLVFITVLAGGLAAIKRYYDIKIPA